MNSLDIIINYHAAIVRGLGATLLICSSAWSLGIIFGTTLGYFAQKRKMLARILAACSLFTISVPAIVLLFWLYYPAQAILGIALDPLLTTIIAMSIIDIILMGDLIKKALDNFPTQYESAARVCGMAESKIFIKIKLPIIFRQVLPGVINLKISILHMSLFGSLISVEEIFRIAQQINAQIYRPVEIYTALGLLFLGMSLPLNLLAAYFKRRFTRDLSEETYA
ncbi:MAG: ABC transporter permease subunit [Candidatus Falkowbacteria bacterium]